MASFLVGVLSSIVATGLVLAAGWLLSRHVRQWLIRLLSRITGLGVYRVYPHQEAAEHDIAHDIARATWLCVLAGRGNTLTRDAFTPLWSGSADRLESTRILLPDPDTGPDSWLDQRECDLGRTDPGFHPGVLAAQVRANATYLAEVARKRANIELHSYDLPNLYRVIATDKAAYITFYEKSAHARNSPCIYARRPGLMYDIALLLFDATWRGSHPLPSAS